MRPVRPDDADCLFRIYGDPATNTFNPAGPYPDLTFARTRLAQWLDGWQKHDIGEMAIYDGLQPQKLIGFGGISVRPLGNALTYNLGYRFATEAWGKGWRPSFVSAFSTMRLTNARWIKSPRWCAPTIWPLSGC